MDEPEPESEHEPEPKASYIDFAAFLAPDFSPSAFANSLVLATNHPSDVPVDLSTPLSRVLFDIQEIDTRVDVLATRSALPLLTHTQTQANAARRIVEDVEAQVASLREGYGRLEKEVVRRYGTAEEMYVMADRLWRTVKLGRAVGRGLLLGRQLQAQLAEVGSNTAGKKDEHKAMTRAAGTLLSIRALLSASGDDEESEQLGRIKLIASLQSSLVGPSEATLKARCQQIIREFSMSSPSTSAGMVTTYAQSEETKSRTTSALLTLCLLSPQLLISALRSYLGTCITSSTASVARALANLPALDRTLLEVAARCQNIVALETLLETIDPPSRTSDEQQFIVGDAISKLDVKDERSNLLEPLLFSLDTSSLPSYFWRSVAEGLGPRVSELIARGGATARALRSQKEKVRESIRECVLNGSHGSGTLHKNEGTWEREAAVMVGSILGALGR